MTPIRCSVRNVTAHQAELELWARHVRAQLPAGSPVEWRIGVSPWTERIALVHAPENTLSYAIIGPDAVYPVGTEVSKVVLSPQGIYQWREHEVQGSDLQAIIDDMWKAVRVFIHADGERHWVGYLPEQYGLDLYNRLGNLYVYSAELTTKQRDSGIIHGLRIEIRERKSR